jgi:mRNA-degrading endonuclease toxin of MazEF toxin-antitoxin module
MEVPLGPREGLLKACVANLHSVLTIPKQFLEQHLGTSPVQNMAEIDQALKFALGLR